MNTYNRYEKFQAYDNQKIHELEALSSVLRKRQIEVEKEINEIQSACNHTYNFVCSGMHKDFYKCILCGHEIEH